MGWDTFIPGEALRGFRNDDYTAQAGFRIRGGDFVDQILVLGFKGRGHQVRTTVTTGCVFASGGGGRGRGRGRVFWTGMGGGAGCWGPRLW